MDKVTVKAPATSANLGPGFDCVGIALSLYNRTTFALREEGLVMHGENPKYCSDHNLLIRGYKAVLDELELPMDGLEVDVEYDIPMSHGLGSSAALIIAGATAANALHGSPLSKPELLRVCCPIEGHLDNLAPAIFGGLTASIMDGDRPLTVAYDLHPSLRFTALVPDFNLSTKLARSVLPDSVSRSDAIVNLSHVAVLLKALGKGDGAAIRAASDERLHQNYRKSLIENFDELKIAALGLGCDAFFISGAGPTLLCVSTDESFFARMEKEIEKFPRWKALELKPDFAGTVIE